jgi:hypothetical protein
MSISRGKLTALWLLLRTLGQLGGEAPESELLKFAQRSGLRAGGLPIRDGIVLARAGGFFEERNGMTVLTELSKHALELSHEDEPSAELVRLFVSALFFREPPSWVAWWQGSPDDLEAVLPAEERRILKSAGLFPPPDSSNPAGWAWWEALGKAPRSQDTSAARKAVGDAGEELTVAYERSRLARQGFVGLAGRVRWLARESDAYGFDVLSYAGGDFADLAPEEPIAIEVKSTSLPDLGRFPLFLSAHEWSVASELDPRSVLHLWSGVSVGPPACAESTQPIVVPSSMLAGHLPGPAACGDSCRWQSARLVLATEELRFVGAGVVETSS